MAALSACSAPPSRGRPEPIDAQTRAALAAEVRTHFGGYQETVAAARAAGYDYLGVIEGALARDRAALESLFKLTHAVAFEGDSVDDHAEVLGVVLRDVGERWFVDALSAEPAETRNEVRQYVAWDFGYQSQTGFDYIRGLYPKLFPDGFYPADYGELPETDEPDEPEPPDDAVPAKTVWGAAPARTACSLTF